ncbi:MAG: histidine kinase [Nitrososphaeraceae archaeon]|nr:histidine kinase [Nitrososphaeraceae archaeon]
MTELVRDIMTKDIVTIDYNKTTLEAAKLMTDRGISSLIVTVNDQPQGIVTERDFIKKICLKDLSLDKVKVSEIMSKIRTFATPDTPLDVAIQRMVNNKVRRLPILNEKGFLVGIITVTDLAKHLRTILLLEGAVSLNY